MKAARCEEYNKNYKNVAHGFIFGNICRSNGSGKYSIPFQSTPFHSMSRFAIDIFARPLLSMRHIVRPQQHGASCNIDESMPNSTMN